MTRIKFHIFLHFGDQRFLDDISVSPELEFRMPDSFYAFRMKSKEIRYYYLKKIIFNLSTIPSNFKTVIQFTDFVNTCLNHFFTDQVLLGLAESIFQEQTSLKKLVELMMSNARNYLHCRRIVIYVFAPSEASVKFNKVQAVIVVPLLL